MRWALSNDCLENVSKNLSKIISFIRRKAFRGRNLRKAQNGKLSWRKGKKIREILWRNILNLFLDFKTTVLEILAWVEIKFSYFLMEQFYFTVQTHFNELSFAHQVKLHRLSKIFQFTRQWRIHQRTTETFLQAQILFLKILEQKPAGSQ